ncbi:MAG: tetratricopeptide repeat-containing protein [Pacificimonas sp.]
MKPSTGELLALLRAGANVRAWGMFQAAGYDRVMDDPAVLTLHGRMLKDRARGADGETRRRGFLASADMYAKAAELHNATYPLINAATLSLLGGDRKRAARLAELTLERLDDPATEPDTPYYTEATRAEALLLLEKIGEARACLEAAIALAPEAWEDHATTLKQFALILAALDLGDDWLDDLRPPASLHFAGHMAIAANDEAAHEQIRAAVTESGARFGYGALAAGSDIIVAEALMAAGGALHVVLPGGVPTFRAQSVSPAGPLWEARFDALIAAAATVMPLDVPAEGAGHLAGVELAGEIAMGLAARNAGTMQAAACQLLVMRGEGDDGLTGMLGEVWRSSGRPQHILDIAASPRADAAARIVPERLAAMAEIDFGTDENIAALLGMSALAQQLNGLETALFPPRWHGRSLTLAYASPLSAFHAMQRILAVVPDAAQVRVAAHYAVLTLRPDPFGGHDVLIGGEAGLPMRMLNAVPAGAVYASGYFANALAARTGAVRPELMGELDHGDGDEPVELFSLHGEI